MQLEYAYIKEICIEFAVLSLSNIVSNYKAILTVRSSRLSFKGRIFSKFFKGTINWDRYLKASVLILCPIIPNLLEILIIQGGTRL